MAKDEMLDANKASGRKTAITIDLITTHSPVGIRSSEFPLEW
jgi:hypothetical protein